MNDDDPKFVYKRPDLSGIASWPKYSLKSVLDNQYPGCKTAVEAVKSVLAKKDKPVAGEKEDPVAKLIQVQNVIAAQCEGVDIEKIPEFRRKELSKMPISTVEEIRHWGFCWLEELKKIRG